MSTGMTEPITESQKNLSFSAAIQREGKGMEIVTQLKTWRKIYRFFPLQAD